MGLFFKGLGEFAGQVAGGVLGGSVKIVGKVTGSKFVEEIGDGVYKATVNTGRVLGQADSGAADVIGGTLSSNEETVKTGFEDIGGSLFTTAKGVGSGVKNIVNGKTVVKVLKKVILTRLERW